MTTLVSFELSVTLAKKCLAAVRSTLTSTVNENLLAHTLDLRRADVRENNGENTSVMSDAGFSFADPSWLSDPDKLEERCRTYLEELRWPEGVACPRCESRECGRIVSRRKFYCRSCRYHFSVTAGTVFHNSHLPVWKWFLIVSVMLDSESGIPSNQLVQLLGGSYKTAWFAQHRVRAAIEDAAGDECCSDSPDDQARCAREAAAERLVDPIGGETRVFDPSIVGPYHQMGVKYLHAYLAEMEWRSTCRKNPRAFRDTVVRLLQCDPLAYSELIARRAAPVARVAPGRAGARRSLDRVETDA